MTASVVTLFLTVGLPGSGKTTRALDLADRLSILRLTPDDWMAPLFGASDAEGRRDILEGRMIWTAHEVLRGGSSVILDFGCWSAEERYAIRDMAERVGARFRIEYLEVEESERRARCARRWATAPKTTFEMSDDDQDRFLALCRPPSESELTYAPIPGPPAGYDDWPVWATRRWPTLPMLAD